MPVDGPRNANRTQQSNRTGGSNRNEGSGTPARSNQTTQATKKDSGYEGGPTRHEVVRDFLDAFRDLRNWTAVDEEGYETKGELGASFDGIEEDAMKKFDEIAQHEPPFPTDKLKEKLDEVREWTANQVSFQKDIDERMIQRIINKMLEKMKEMNAV